MKMGSGFQIVDDLLDLTGEEQNVGKSLGTDLEKAKMTLPLLRLRDRASAADRARLKAAIESNDANVRRGVVSAAERVQRDRVRQGDRVQARRRGPRGAGDPAGRAGKAPCSSAPPTTSCAATASRPAAFCAARRVFWISIAIVIGPTPPGTGVILPAISDAAA